MATSAEAFQVAQDTHTNDDKVATLAVFTQLALLAIAFVVGHWLAKRRVSWLSEAGFALLLGVAVGCVVKFFTNSSTFAEWISFKKEFFFIALLPPIIFDAGFSLKVKPFFNNIGAIAAYAFIGTTVSTFVIGLIIWVAGWHISAPLTFLEASLYGAIVSATDPVTVLAIFHRLHVDENLYALVFGESVLNDAVAIVLYGTLTLFLDQPVTLGVCVRALGTFVGIFAGSMVIGVVFALLASLAVKSKYFRSQDMPLESILVVLLAYSSYMLADGLKLSGIVAILFCGMVMAHYTRPNLSRTARDRTTSFVKMLATLAETFVFIYIGVSLFLEDQAWDRGLTWAFLGMSLVALAISRALNIFPCTYLINMLRTPETRIPPRHTFMLWFSGLRGAMAFALSLQAASDLPAGAGRVILTSTFFIVLITVLVNGGFTTYLIEKLELKQQTAYTALLQEEGVHLGGGGGHGSGGRSPSPGGNSNNSSPPPDSLHHFHTHHDDHLYLTTPYNEDDSGGGALHQPGGGGNGGGGGNSKGAMRGMGGMGLDVVDARAGPLEGVAWPIRASSPTTPAPGGTGILRNSLTKLREANKTGFVLNNLHRFDERFGRHFMPSQASDDVELAQVPGASTVHHRTTVVEQGNNNHAHTHHEEQDAAAVPGTNTPSTTGQQQHTRPWML